MRFARRFGPRRGSSSTTRTTASRSWAGSVPSEDPERGVPVAVRRKVARGDEKRRGPSSSRDESTCSQGRRRPARPGVAVLGCGYWGQNLVRNFHRLGALTLVCDPAESARSAGRDDRARRRGPGGSLEADPRSAGHPGDRDRDAGGDALRPDDAGARRGQGRLRREAARPQLRAGRWPCVRRRSGAAAILMVGHLLEYHPAVLELRRLIADGSPRAGSTTSTRTG